MRARDTFVQRALPRHRRKLALAPAWPARSAVSRNQRRAQRARQHSLTSAIDSKPEHTGERPFPGALPLFTTERCAFEALRRSENRTDRSDPESAPCKARKPAPILKRTSQSPRPVSTPWRMSRKSRFGLGPPRARRANGYAFGNEPGCLSLLEIPSLPIRPGGAALRQAYARLARTFSRLRRAPIVDGSASFPQASDVRATRQQRAA